LVAVETDEGGGAFVVGGEADLNGFGAVVFAAKEGGTAVIANAFVLGRLGGDVKDGFAFGAGAASAETSDDFWSGKLVIDDGVEGEIFLLEKIAEGLRLGESAREAVEEKAALATETAGAFADHIPDGGIGNESATAHVLEGGSHGGRWRAFGAGSSGAEHVSGGEMAGAEAFVEELGLRAFAYAGSAEEDEAPARFAVGGLGSALSGRTLEPRGAIGLCGHWGNLCEDLAKASVRKGANSA